jgi:enamine deaminase RidA (YjgF/YER057c/UK114 family)
MEQMRKISHNPSTLMPPIGHFDRAVQIGPWLFISGTSALTNVSGAMEDRRLVQGIEAQTRETLDNIERVLQAAGGALAQIYELRIVLRRRDDFGIVDRILRERMPHKGFIAHAYEGVLLHPEMELEIEANAFLEPVAPGEDLARTAP